MTDTPNTLTETRREIGRKRIAAGDARTALLRRRYDAPIEDVWDACTNPERLNRWFLPVSGDLRLGGTFQLEGNAGGEILHCDPPRRLTVSWVCGNRAADEVELRLFTDGDGTVLELEHASIHDVFLNDPETGIWGVPVGWEIPLSYSLGKYLRGELPDAPAVEWYVPTPEDLELGNRLGRVWAEIVEAADVKGKGKAPDPESQ